MLPASQPDRQRARQLNRQINQRKESEREREPGTEGQMPIYRAVNIQTGLLRDKITFCQDTRVIKNLSLI